jgi:primosomal protein N' (replication factor Y)
MYIKVKLLKGFKEELTYHVPVHYTVHEGSLVTVPIRTKTAPALVIACMLRLHEPVSYIIKDIVAVEPFPHDPHYVPFVEQLSRYYQLDQLTLVGRLRQFLNQKETATELPESSATHEPMLTCLTPEQQTVVDFVTPYIKQPSYMPTLLHGVTGSGKTEVYKKLIIETIAQHKAVLFLVPEVTLAVHFQALFKQQLPTTILIIGFHSATSIKEKRTLWHLLRGQQPVVIVGVHLPILLPLPHVGLLLIDEEHDVGFQEKKHPKINSKEAALMRAQRHNIPIVLGSATPSVSSLNNVNQRNWSFFTLKKRFAGAFPTVQVVPLNDKKQRRNFWISTKLEHALANRLARGEQAIIFLNRRGYSFFVQCKQCGFIFSCSQCSVSLTLHAHDKLHCHYCGMQHQLAAACPHCSADAASFLKKGIGTQQIVAILQTLFPRARIGRADLDTTVNRKEWQNTMHAMRTGELDILVGTQTVTKGHHFPHVTLVGVLWADLNLNFPIYNAAEITLQQLIQVAGRAGRQSSSSSVIVQTMIDHPIFAYLNEIDYLKFFDQELELRILLGYPPHQRLIELELKYNEEEQLDHDAQLVVHRLQQAMNANMQILGPAKPPVHTIQNTHRRKIYLKGNSIQQLITLYEKIQKDDLQSALFFTPNPLNI